MDGSVFEQIRLSQPVAGNILAHGFADPPALTFDPATEESRALRLYSDKAYMTPYFHSHNLGCES